MNNKNTTIIEKDKIILRKDSIIKEQHKTEHVILDKNTIKRFRQLANRRDIRQSQVNKIIRRLEKGKSWESTIYVSRHEDADNLLDGNHRYEAAKIYLQRHPERKISITLGVFEGLNEQEESEIYTVLNSGISQNINDFVKNHWDEIPITKHLSTKRGFPWNVSYKWTENAIELKTLVGAYLTKENTRFVGGFSGGKEEFVQKARELTISDTNVIKQFLSEYIDVFGKPHKKNMHYRQAVFYSLFRIWLDNKNMFNPETIKNRFERVRMHPAIQQYAIMGGTREVCILCRNELLLLLNGNRKRDLFTKSDAEIKKEQEIMGYK